MALVVTQKSKAYRAFEGDGLKMKFLTLDLGVYATGGIGFNSVDAEMEVIHDVCFMNTLTANVHKCRYDGTNKKVVAYGDSVNQVANDTNITGQKINVLVFGY